MREWEKKNERELREDIARSLQCGGGDVDKLVEDMKKKTKPQDLVDAVEEGTGQGVGGMPTK